MPDGRTHRRDDRQRSASLLGALLLVGGVLVVSGPARAARAEELADVEAKAQYAYFTDDLRSLQQLANEIKGWAQSSDSQERYHYAHVKLRLLQSALATNQAAVAGHASRECESALGSHGPPSAEFLVLSGLCQGFGGSLSGLRKAVTAARRLEPHNPRVLLGEAYAESLAAPTGPPNSAALAVLRESAAAFDRVTAPAPGAPTWGAAEAALLLGQGLARSGDTFAARNALERCLVIAPDFHAASRSLAALGVGGR